MTTAKLFRNGRSQAVRLPKEFAMRGEEVYVRRVGQATLVPQAAAPRVPRNVCGLAAARKRPPWWRGPGRSRAITRPGGSASAPSVPVIRLWAPVHGSALLKSLLLSSGSYRGQRSPG